MPMPVLLSAALMVSGIHWLPGKANLTAKRSPQERPARTPARAAATPAATRTFTRYCASCHGEDFTGGDVRSSTREIPDFTKEAWQKKRTDAQLLASILDGKGSHMPSYRGRLSKDQASDLVAFIRQAGPDPSAKPAPADDFEERLNELLQEMEDLRKQYRRMAPPPAKK